MARRNNDRKPARKKPFREPKRRILIVCEGENTEPQYLKGLQRIFRNPRVELKVIGAGTVPLNLVKQAKACKAEADEEAKHQKDDNIKYDDVWCVFDRDDHSKMHDAFVTAGASHIDIAFSNPCFELWLLLHFIESPGMQHRDDLGKLLRKEVKSYDKDQKRIVIEDYIKGYDDAVKRAKALCKVPDDKKLWERNPYTDVHVLTELIRQS